LSCRNRAFPRRYRARKATLQDLTTPAQDVIRYPSLRGLKSIAGARHELARLYLEVKNGLIEPVVAGRLMHALSILINSTRDHDLETRLDKLEATLAEARGQPIKPNGNGQQRPGARL
jgi:hypothetical protein